MECKHLVGLLGTVAGWGPALTDTAELPSYIQRARSAGKVLLDQWTPDYVGVADCCWHHKDL